MRTSSKKAASQASLGLVYIMAGEDKPLPLLRVLGGGEGQWPRAEEGPVFFLHVLSALDHGSGKSALSMSSLCHPSKVTKIVLGQGMARRVISRNHFLFGSPRWVMDWGFRPLAFVEGGERIPDLEAADPNQFMVTPDESTPVEEKGGCSPPTVNHPH